MSVVERAAKEALAFVATIILVPALVMIGMFIASKFGVGHA